MKKKKISMGTMLAMGCMVLMTGCVKTGQTETPKISDPIIMTKSPEEKYGEKEETEVSTKEGEVEEMKQETESKMDLKGLSEGIISVLEIERESVEKELLKWTSENGYASAAGAVFYDPMWIYFSEDKYSIDCHLVFNDGGNGIQPEEAQKKITMDYYKTKRRIEFHE